MMRIALCEGIWGRDWTENMAKALLSEKAFLPADCKCDRVDINKHDWLATLKDYNAILWPPGCMGIKPSSHLKEKIYFLQYHMGKLVVPNFETVWHFESKVAQSYLFELYGIPTPRTVSTFSLQEALALLSKENYPLVFKTSSDAASRGVRLVNAPSFGKFLAWKELYIGLLWKGIRRLFRLDHRDNVAYWQEFISGNDSDLRITAIGDRYAFGFWRRNRPNDFRASGSGRIDYEKPIPDNLIHFCLDINKRLNFDSMAYDFIFRDDSFLVTEISYTYLDHPIFKTSGYFECNGSGQLEFQKGHTWPEQLWVRWLAERLSGLSREHA
jgi:glutathione synthase/RimK-type ligase-like ATP-grasp enzyme